MREVRRVYRAQYLQKLAEVTEIERAREEELHQRALAERRRRKQAHLQRIGEDMKRRAILKDRLRVEAKVNEAIEMARRSKLKRQKLFWFRRMENLSKLIVSAANFNETFGGVLPDGLKVPGELAGDSLSSSGVLLSRNVSVPFLLRQLGGAKGYPQQKSRRIPHVDNVQREILELSYDMLPEDEPRFAPEPADGPSPRERALQLYGGFSQEEKMALLEQKIDMLKRKLESEEKRGTPDQITQRLLDELESVRLAQTEGETAAGQKAAARAARGADPIGLPSRKGKDGARDGDT